MSFFNSLHFLVVTAACIGFYFAFVRFTKSSWHELFLLAMSVYWTRIFFEIPLRFLALKMVLLSGMYFLVTTRRFRREGLAISVGVIATACAWWVFLRFPHSLGVIGLPSVADSAFLKRRILYFVGIPFTICRVISFTVDVRRNDANARGVVSFLLYILYFPTLMSGPVTVYHRFVGIEAPVVNRNYIFTNIVPGMKRVILGIFKRQLVASFLWSISLPFIRVESATPLQLCLGAYAYYFYLFADFSGYTDLALGISKVMNVNLPENFNLPFLARNPREFWRRWHISFLDWLNEYVLTPLYSFELKWFPRVPTPILSAFAIFATFLFVGLWHGEAMRYVLYGLLNALALWAYRLYDDSFRKNAPDLRRRLLRSPLVAGVSVLLCFHYVVFALMVFSLDPATVQTVLRRLVNG